MGASGAGGRITPQNVRQLASTGSLGAKPAVAPAGGTGQSQGFTPGAGFGMPPRPQPNVYQQSAQSIGQAQRTMIDLSRFTPQQMQAARAAPTATFGGAQVERTPAYGGSMVAPTERVSAASMGAPTQMQSVGAVRSAQAPDQIAVDQLRTMDIGQYMNPYTQQVIETGQADIERQRQLASENLAAQAQKARAFGGSRQAVQEGVLAGEALRQAGALSAQQRQTGFQQAIQAGQFDIGQTQAARTLASQQQFQAEQLGQQAREMAAAREQAARAGNVQAANQFAQQQAQLTQQAGLANQAAANARAAQQAGLTQQAGLAGASQAAARASQQAGLTQQAGLSNQAAINQAIQAQAARQQAANAANFQGQFSGAGIRQGAAGSLAGLGQQQFGIGQAIQQQQAQQGAVQRGLMQGLIGAGQQSFGQYTGAPTGGMGTLMSSLTGVPTGQTQSTQPGFLNYLQAAAMF